MSSSVLAAGNGGAATRGNRASAVPLLISVSALAALVVEIGLHPRILGPHSLTFGGMAAAALALAIALQTIRLRETRAMEELYRTIVETSHDGICIIGSDRRYRFVNPRYAEMLGRTAEELLGADSLAFVQRDDRAAVSGRFEQRKHGLAVAQAELRIVRKDGSLLDVIAATTSLLRNGRYDGIVCLVTDISERKRNEIALRASEARFRGLYDANVAGVCFMRPGDCITEANEKFLQTYGIDGTTQVAWESLTAPASRDADARALEELRRTGRCTPYEKECIRPDGARLFVLTAVAMLDVETQLAVCFTIDVTAQTEARCALQRAHEVLSARLAELEGAGPGPAGSKVEELAAHLAAAYDELQTFHYSVSHDLRAPLRAVDGFARELQLDETSTLSEAGRQYVSRIRTSAHRMAAMTDGLLHLSRASRTELRRHPGVDLSSMARGILAELVESQQRAIAIDVQDDLTAAGDPDLLRTVLENLLGNAVKFTARTAEPRIAFGFENGAFFVRDNGAGFDPRYAAKLFRPFHRLHSSTEFEGSGIGLATVDRIVQRHGGRIWADAAPAAGATFSFTLGTPEIPHATTVR